MLSFPKHSVIVALLPETFWATKTKTLQQELARTVVALWQHQHALATRRAFHISMAVDFLDRCFGLNHDGQFLCQDSFLKQVALELSLQPARHKQAKLCKATLLRFLMLLMLRKNTFHDIICIQHDVSNLLKLTLGHYYTCTILSVMLQALLTF